MSPSGGVTPEEAEAAPELGFLWSFAKATTSLLGGAVAAMLLNGPTLQEQEAKHPENVATTPQLSPMFSVETAPLEGPSGLELKGSDADAATAEAGEAEDRACHDFSTTTSVADDDVAAVATVAPFQSASANAEVGPDLSTGISFVSLVGPAASPPRSPPPAAPPRLPSVTDELLAGLEVTMVSLRVIQRHLVMAVEEACRSVLKLRHFGRVEVVGSAALCVETPGSDIDLVCFTRDWSEMPGDTLCKVRDALVRAQRWPDAKASGVRIELIDEARVPILRVVWGSEPVAVAVDLSIDQSLPVDHVFWFRRAGLAPATTPCLSAPPVTQLLRCVKWWLKQRQMPRAKEGGLATLAWLLLAVHIFDRFCDSSGEESSLVSEFGSPKAMVFGLKAFFDHFAKLGSFDGTFSFAEDPPALRPAGSLSHFEPSVFCGSRLWGELTVLDPTRVGKEIQNLAPRLPPATQLLMAYELSRAQQVLLGAQSTGRGERSGCRGGNLGNDRECVAKLFQAVPEGANILPSKVTDDRDGILVYLGDASGGMGSLEVACLTKVVPRRGWNAPFLHRSDERSQVELQLCDVVSKDGKCRNRRRGHIVLCPCHFICRLRFTKEGKDWRLDGPSLERYHGVRDCFLNLCKTAFGDTSQRAASA